MTFSDSFQNLPGSRTPKTRHCRGVYRLFLLSFGILITYWLILTVICGWDGIVACDPLNKVLFDMGEPMGGFGGWYITHFIFFYIVGLLFPDCMLLAMTIGVFFEILETFSSNFALNEHRVSGVQYSKVWEGTLMDLFFNFTGFVAGMLTTKYFLNGKPPKVPWISAESSEDSKDENYKNLT